MSFFERLPCFTLNHWQVVCQCLWPLWPPPLGGSFQLLHAGIPIMCDTYIGLRTCRGTTELLLSLSLPVQVYCAERASQWSDTPHHEYSCRSFCRSPHRLIGCFSPCVMDLKRVVVYKSESRFSAGTDHAGTLILAVPASRTVRNTQFIA